MSTHTALLDVQGLSVGHGCQPVLEAVSFDLAAGDLLCLLGPNGSGKTTLLRTLLGLQAPLAGRVCVLGRPLPQWSRRRLAHHIGYVPQAHAGLFSFTVLDIVLMGRAARLRPFASPSAEDADIALQSLHTLGIAALADRSYTHISGGERQLTLIARALAQEARLLLLDEPTSSLDFGNQIRVLEHLSQLRQQGMAMLMSTHQPEHALRCANRTALVGDGQLLALGETRAIATPARLAQLYRVPESAIACLNNSALFGQ